MKPNYNHCAECKKRGKICPECEEDGMGKGMEDGMGEGMEDGMGEMHGKPDEIMGEGDDAVPVFKLTVTGKKSDKPEEDRIYEADDLEESNNKGIESGMEHLKFLRDQLSEATDDAEKKRIKGDISEWSALLLKRHKQHRPAPADGENITDKKKKVVSLLDVFNPSRPMGMR